MNAMSTFHVPFPLLVQVQIQHSLSVFQSGRIYNDVMKTDVIENKKLEGLLMLRVLFLFMSPPVQFS